MVEPVRIFVGSDRSQLFAVKVLEHSIKRHTSAEVCVTPMHDINLPAPQDIRQSARTGFSFTRFAIPKLSGYQGKAIYMDADMLVFKDIISLWNIPFDGATVILQEDLPEQYRRKQKTKGHTRRKQSAVMLLNCDLLRWEPENIISGLDGKYTYEELMYDFCIIPEQDIKYAIPLEWNSMEHYEEGKTCLLHYTDMQTQPWVYTRNPLGILWINEIKMMLENNTINADDLRKEVDLGYLRPSLLAELGITTAAKLTPRELEKIDRDAGFRRHKEVFEQQRRRKEAIYKYEKSLNGGKNKLKLIESVPDRVKDIIRRIVRG